MAWKKGDPRNKHGSRPKIVHSDDEGLSAKELSEWLADSMNVLYAAARRYAYDWRDIDDLAQHMVVYLYGRKHTYLPDKPVLQWVNAHVKYAAADYFQRKHAQEGWVSLDELSDMKREIAASKPTRAKYDQCTIDDLDCMGLLTPAERAVVRMCIERNMTLREISREFNESRDWALARFNSAKLKLRAYFTPED